MSENYFKRNCLHFFLHKIKNKTVEFKGIKICEGIESLGKFSQVAEDSERFGLSDLASFLMINHILAAVDKTDEFVSKSGFRKLRKRVRSKEKRNYERKYRRLRVFKFDGKISWNSVRKGKKVKKTNITVMTEPENKYINHFSCRDNGLNVGTGLWKCIEDTDSVDTLEAVGCDGCTVNTSPKGQLIQRELKLDGV